jgi:hypothetical protein
MADVDGTRVVVVTGLGFSGTTNAFGAGVAGGAGVAVITRSGVIGVCASCFWVADIIGARIAVVAPDLATNARASNAHIIGRAKA